MDPTVRSCRRFTSQRRMRSLCREKEKLMHGTTNFSPKRCAKPVKRLLSLSRLNHGQPGVQAHPEIVQSTAELHDEIADALLPQADPVFHNATTLDAAVDMLDPEPPLVERLVGQVLLQGQLPTARLLRRHEDRHLRKREGQEAQIL